ncbi:hypothetical protein QE152_g20794 [Popillia japonica]|uniref:Uncharacterized protein n=1 Tax=Popillia japonica TaxID=7064 RepID=A0AAW1KQ62_POPJA
MTFENRHRQQVIEQKQEIVLRIPNWTFISVKTDFSILILILNIFAYQYKFLKKSEDKAVTVPGLGFKTEEKALDFLKIFEGRDPNDRKLAVKDLIGCANRVITLTKDKKASQDI